MNLTAQKPEPNYAEIEFRDVPLLIDLRGCLFWPDEKLLVVSDLHLEKGSSFAARKRVFLPPYDTQATLKMLTLCISEWQPKTVLSLGDSFHDDDAAGRLPSEFSLALRQMMQEREWIWVCGNHDPTPPENIGGSFCTEIQIGPLNFIHEPKADSRKGEIAGHLHPCAKIRKRGKSLRRRCFVGDKNRMIMPAFGSFTGGLNIRDSAYQGLLDERSLRAWLLSNSGIYEFGARQLVG
ncbi:MAG: ligase-associated DNA damage response endonuclease PdeM [Rhizobiaceae bacterium]